MKKVRIILLLTILILGCNTYKDISIGTKITTPEVEYDSTDYEEPPVADEQALDDAIESVQD